MAFISVAAGVSQPLEKKIGVNNEIVDAEVGLEPTTSRL